MADDANRPYHDLLNEALTELSVVSAYTQLIRRRTEQDQGADPAMVIRSLRIAEGAIAEAALRVRLLDEQLWSGARPAPSL